MTNIVFVGCSKNKNKGPMKAYQKYSGSLFKKELKYAMKIANLKDIYILSAKYGLITLNTIIDDYNLNLKDFDEAAKRRWAYRVIKQAEKQGICKEDKIIFLCGNNYSKYLKRYYKNHEDPTEGLRIEKTGQWYNQHT